MPLLAKIAPFFAFVIMLATSANAQVMQITPDEARAKALAGEIVLVDIRRPDEWADTGIPDVALTADMTTANFIQTLLAIRDQNPETPLAIICRSGNRSGFVTQQLYQAGMTNVIDVVEGISGSGIGPGWKVRGLPLRPTDAPVNPQITTQQP